MGILLLLAIVISLLAYFVYKNYTNPDPRKVLLKRQKHLMKNMDKSFRNVERQKSEEEDTSSSTSSYVIKEDGTILRQDNEIKSESVDQDAATSSVGSKILLGDDNRLCVTSIQTQEEATSRDAAVCKRQKLRDKLINSIKNGCKIQFDGEESVSYKICDGIDAPIADHNLNNNTATNIALPPSHIDRWYDKYPGLYKIRLSYLHQFFPHFESKIERGSLTGLCSGNIIFLSGTISFGTKNNNEGIISYDIEIRIEGYWSRTDISTSDDNLAYISSIMGYTPTPFGSCWFKEHSSSISTLLDTVMNAYEWLSLLDCGLRGDLHCCFFGNSTMNVPEQNSIGTDKDSEFNVLNEDTYLYQTPASRRRREIRYGSHPHYTVKLK